MNAVIEVENVGMSFRTDINRIGSLKEWVVTLLKGKMHYENIEALKDVSFSVEEGEVLGIIGRNGSGKSTLLKTISGIYTPTSGSVRVNGRIAPMLELGSGFDQELSGRENISLNASILGYTEQQIREHYDDIVEFSELSDFIEMPLKTYSSGMKAKLAFSVATVLKPEILIVDEILSVGDEAFQRKSRARMMEMMSGGTTVLFVSHDMEQIRELCNRVVWLDKGNVRMIGNADEVCSRYLETMG